ncbi:MULTISPECIES: PP2C family serine/threonine-protein phosphatase [Streptomyces]|jgi:serine/threonine protein phosphatase PrpC|uniref:Serine/threonine protein phosphatase PrpC n=1 Tax=Streptomyces nymphaeiformis TaxID=2663842 RepID=A0A7W7TUQ4_9ACTN|nr:PP2C family serine/threonine-protein phosphatase [Streptomyces nymphaeiformis]MBB4979421.1 serine/threonine protein phosphatase PrpC [Streptomyces nymphaeiformis]
MSQKPKPSHGLAACPGCAEPLESGDRFCGACGYDLSAVPAAEGGADRPTVAIVTWPDAPPRDPGSLSTMTQHPGDLPGTDSGGRDLPTMEVRTDGPAPAESGAPAPAPGGPPAPAPHAVGSPTPDGDFELAAPDPRTAVRADPAPEPAAAAPTAPAAAPSAALCVACRAGRVDTDGYCENCGHAQPHERDHTERELSGVAAVSDRGLRHHRNEDAFAVASTTLPDGSPATLAIVCDGVSSATRPDEASAAAAEAAGASLLAALPRGAHPQQAMHEAIVAAAEAVNSLAEEPGQDGAEHDPHRHRNAPACTIVGSVVASGLLVVGWVGDSRAYWVPDDRSAPPARLTEDDSWAAQMVAAGLMNEAEAYADERAHAITGWLGADSYELDPHTAAFKPDRSGVVVVCTDGLWNYAEAAEDMARVVPADAADRLLHGAQVLVGHALDGGGHDNITVALVPFTVTPQGAGSA